MPVDLPKVADVINQTSFSSPIYQQSFAVVQFQMALYQQSISSRKIEIIKADVIFRLHFNQVPRLNDILTTSYNITK